MRMNVVQQAEVDEICQNLKDRALGSAFKRSVNLLHAMVNADSGPPVRTRRAGAMAMATPPVQREEEKNQLDESIDKLQAEAQQLEGHVTTLRSERQEQRTQQSVSRTTGKLATGKQQTQEGAKGTPTGSTPQSEGGPKNEGKMTTTEGAARTPDARKTQQNQSNSPTAEQPVASKEDLEGGREAGMMASELSDEPGAAQITPDDIISIVNVIVGLWKRFRGR